MSSDKTNHTDEAATLHAEILARMAREHRHKTRDYIVIFANRGMPADRITEILDVDPETVARALAVHGHRACSECIFDRHTSCTGYHYRDALYIAACECSCHPLHQDRDTPKASS